MAPSPVVDPGLLALLPTSVDGNPVVDDAEATQGAAIDADLAQALVRIAHAYVGDPAGDNWAYMTLVEVRRDALTDDFHRQWLANFAALACTPGGASGSSQVVIGVRVVEVTQCASGVLEYGVRLEETGILISVMGYGELGYAQILLEGIGPGA